jgi:type I restriction enzyme S subunit
MKLLEGWKEVKLEEITTCLDGKRVPLNSEERRKIKGDIPYYGANGQLDSINKFIFDEELLLLAEDGGSWGFNQTCSYIIRGRSWVNNHAHVLRMNDEVDLTYLMHSLNYHDLNRFISGTTRGKLNQRVMNKIPIIIPPLETQKKIVSILEKAEKAKEWRKKADDLTKDFLKSIFSEMFGKYLKEKKNYKKILYFCPSEKSAIKAGPFGSLLKKEFYVEKGYKIYGQEQVIKNDFTYGDYYIDEERYKKLENYKIKSGDILISLVGSYGHISIVPEKFEPGIINPRLMKITLDKTKMNPVFFRNLFLSSFIKEQLKRVSHGGTMDIINVGIIKDIDFPDIPISLQNKFALIVKEVEAMKEQQKNSKEQIDNLFNALMQKAFKGELII